MRSQRLEARVLDLVESVLAGRRVEDDRIEFKGEWPTDYRRAARQIAGLANTAGGEPILWVVGVDEDAGTLTNYEALEFSTWWPQVERCLDEDVVPEPYLLTVALPEGHRVVAIEFDTSRAPYVVTTSGQGQVHREIPWRKGNSTRSARRSEILRSVVEEASVPRLTLISGGGTLDKSDRHLSASLDAQIFVEATGRAMLPEHLWSCDLMSVQGEAWPLEASLRGPVSSGEWGLTLTQTTPVERRGTIEYVPGSGLHIAGADSVTLHAYARLDVAENDRERLIAADTYELNLRMPIALSSRAVTARIRFAAAGATGVGARFRATDLH